jgi:hypothetical protein
MEEQLDADRFGIWLEVLAESGAAFAARQLAGIDTALIVAALAQHLAVFDPAVFSPSTEHDGGDVAAASSMRSGLHAEVGGYLVRAKRPDAWDTIVAVLIALEEEDGDCFRRVMRGCRRLSSSTPEPDGFHDLLLDPAQAAFDLAADRERGREKLGYLTPLQARAFLQLSRGIRLDQGSAPPANPLSNAYFRAVEDVNRAEVDHLSTPMSQPGAPATEEPSGSAVAALVDVLQDAGVLVPPERPRALLGGAFVEAPRLARFQEHMQFVRMQQPAVYEARGQELAFLANAIVSGCAIQTRPFTAREASDAVVAVCNLGLEHWPRRWLALQSGFAAVDATPGLPADFLVLHDLATVFQVGWTVLHRDVCMFAAERLIDILSDLRCRDPQIQAGLDDLRREMARHSQAGAPWRARDALDVLAILDLPAWAALLAMIDECPVLLANVAASGPSRPRAIDPSAFEFISENRQLAAVREFMRTLPEALQS